MAGKKKMPRRVQLRIRRTLKKGALQKYGYNLDKSAAARRRALAKCVKAEGYTTCFRRINYMIVVRKGAKRGVRYENRKKLEADRDWMRKKYRGK